MIQYNSNGSEVFGVIVADIKKLLTKEENDKLLRKIASTLTASMTIRVHQEGEAADGSKIGTYSPEYMKVRTGQFANSETYKKGKNKGKTKNAGTVSRGDNKGSKRKKYNRTSDTKVILSLTRQMEQDLSVCEQEPIKTSYGYAIGYHNDDNYDKLLWNEERYGKKILTKLSKGEEELIDYIVQKELDAKRID